MATAVPPLGQSDRRARGGWGRVASGCFLTGGTSALTILWTRTFRETVAALKEEASVFVNVRSGKNCLNCSPGSF